MTTTAKTPITDQDVLDALVRARDLIADPDHWCRGAGAMDANGVGIPEDDPTAVRWCALGARWLACSYVGDERRMELSARMTRIMDRHLLAENGSYGLANLNDGPDGHRRVLAVYDASIAEAQRMAGVAPAPGEWVTLTVDLPEVSEVWTKDDAGAQYMDIVEPAVRRARAFGLHECWAHGENVFVHVACSRVDPKIVYCEAFKTLLAAEGDHPDMVGLERVRFQAVLREPLVPGVQYAAPPDDDDCAGCPTTECDCDPEAAE